MQNAKIEKEWGSEKDEAPNQNYLLFAFWHFIFHSTSSPLQLLWLPTGNTRNSQRARMTTTFLMLRLSNNNIKWDEK